MMLMTAGEQQLQITAQHFKLLLPAVRMPVAMLEERMMIFRLKTYP